MRLRVVRPRPSFHRSFAECCLLRDLPGFLDPDTPPVWRLIKRAFAMPDRSALIESIFSNKDGIKIVRGLHEDDAQSFIDVIDEARYTLARRKEIRGNEIDTFIFWTPGTIKHTRSFTTDPKEMPQIVVQGVWSARAPSDCHEGHRPV